jgi:hypothetical protein
MSVPGRGKALGMGFRNVALAVPAKSIPDVAPEISSLTIQINI